MATRKSFFVRSMLGSAVLGVLLVMALVNFAPDASPYSPDNYGWNGLRDLTTHYSVQFVDSLAGLRAENSVLLIVQPVSSYSPEQVNEVHDFTSDGGTAVVAGYSPQTDSLLQALGTGVAVQGQYEVNDATYNWRGQTLPVALVNRTAAQAFGFLGGLDGIAMDQPSPLAISPGSGAYPAALSSALSFETERSSSISGISVIGGSPDLVAQGPFVVAAVESVGKGAVVVLGDSEFFTNSLWNVADNGALMANLFSNATVYVDASHMQTDSVASLKAELGVLYSGASAAPLRYLLTGAVVALAVGTLPVLAFDEPVGSGGATDGERPRTAYNVAALERVKKDRRRYGS